MEDHLQTIIGIIISVFLLFIFPVYAAYEKKDDVSYALALKYTEEFVKSVEKTGYLTKDMYDSYKTKLKVTGNSYKIELTHTYNRYEPIVNYYEKDDDSDELVKTNSTSREYYDNLTDTEKSKLNVKLTYESYKEKYYTDYIQNILNNTSNKESSNIYTFNVDDEFTVSITNTNLTPATLIFNMLTINSADKVERIYVNYGGKILTSQKYNKAYYSFENTGLINNTCELLEISDTDILSSGMTLPTWSCGDTVQDYSKNFTVEFDALPSKVTRIDNVNIIKVPSEILNQYSILISGTKGINIPKKMVPIYVSVGTNGITVLAEFDENQYYTILSYPIDIYDYTNVKLQLKDNIPYLYIDGEEVVKGSDYAYKNNKNLYINNILAKDENSIGTYYGKVKNIRIYTATR